MKTDRIPDHVLSILSRVECAGNAALLTCGQLEPATYKEVNRVLEALGGKWDRRVKGHVFPEDPAARLEVALLTGTYTRPQSNGYFPTPRPLAEHLCDLAELAPGQSILEPSAGQGHILEVIEERARKWVVWIGCVEILPENRKALVQRGYDLVWDDFLTYWPGKPLTGGFDRIVMNPPFERQQDVAHVLHAWELLRPGGRLVSIMAAGFTFREDRKSTEFRALVERHGRWEANPEGSFKDAGTAVRTVTVVMDKPAVSA